jgi:hypothetical protein
MVKGYKQSAVVLAVAVLSIATAGAQSRPLPDQDAFLKETRKHLQTDSSVQSSYMYVETRRELKLDKNGRTQEESVKVFESYPGLPGQPRWERLISENGKAIAANELAEQDRDRSKQANAMAKRLENDPGKERARQQRDWNKAHDERSEAVDDIYVVYAIQMTGRERVEGHDTIAFTLTPRPDSRPKTREGDLMKRFGVKAWISEADHELVRLEAEAIDNVAFGLGVLARIHKGAQFSFLRRKVNDEVWLPAVAKYSGSARVGLLWTLRRTGSSEYSAYKKFSVDTSSSFEHPK